MGASVGSLAACAAVIWGACSQSDSPAGAGSSTGGTGGAAGSHGAGGRSGAAGGSGAVGDSGAAGDSVGGNGTPGRSGAAGSNGASGASGGNSGDGGVSAGVGPNVLQYHKSSSRDGLYVDAAFTRAAAAKMHMDTAFKATIQGPTYAQPLYFEGGPGGESLVITVTEQNQVSAFEASTGAVVWQKTIGTPVAKSMMPCGNIDPFGITGTPVIDPVTRTLFFDAMTTTAGGRHFIFAVSLDDGSTRTGWPIDVTATVTSGQKSFASSYHSQRGALALVNGTLYVPYGGLWGDCGTYYGWVVAVPIDNPSAVKAFATTAAKSGIWGPGGIASDGTSIWVTTGNAPPGTAWGGQEAVLRLSAGAVFSEQPADFFRPSNWQALDDGDVDLGGSGPVLVDVPGATPSKLVVLLGKNGVAYLVDRENLGGTGKGDGVTGEGLDSSMVSATQIIQGAAAYTTPRGTYVALRGTGMGAGCSGELITIKLSAASPPKISVAWCANQGGSGSPIVTTTDGISEAIVWGLGTGTGRLMGFDGETGDAIFSGGGASDQMQSIQGFQTAIAARGRIFVAADNAVYAFTMQ